MKKAILLSTLICTLAASVTLTACADKDSSANSFAETAVTTAAVSTSAEEVPPPKGEVVYKGKLGGDRTYSLYEDGALLINGTGEIKDYNSSNCPFREKSSEIKRAIISDGITRIGAWTFCHSGALTSISLPSGVTSIGDFAFCDCKALTGISMPEGVITVGNNAFLFCEGLESVWLPNSLRSIENNAFQNCTALTVITIPEGVTSIGEHAFLNCSALKSITIPGSVTDIGMYAFGYQESDLGGSYIKYDAVTIKGKAGSAAEKYAEVNGFSFVAI